MIVWTIGDIMELAALGIFVLANTCFFVWIVWDDFRGKKK